MKFNIFSLIEIIGKALIYLFILFLTCGLLYYFSTLTEESNTFVFVASIIYALIMFLVSIPINKIDKYTEEKLDDRKRYFLSLQKLREVTKATICKINLDDLDDMKTQIFFFQLFTGRCSAMTNKCALDNISPTCVNENGFVFTNKLINYENNFLVAYEKNAKWLKRNAKKLNKYYKDCCNKLNKNYMRLERIYGGKLINLIEHETKLSNIKMVIEDINLKLNKMSEQISDLSSAFDEISRSNMKHISETQQCCDTIIEQLDYIECNGLLDEDKKLSSPENRIKTE